MPTGPATLHPDPDFDAIVIGARCAGASTAMLLARRGYRVLVVDRATFPSDTLSTHQVQLPGSALLARWGLLDQIIAAGTPPARHVRFDLGPIVLEGHYPTFQGIGAVYSPRRTVLDTILVGAARGAGAEVHEGFIVDELVAVDGQVKGVRGRERHGTTTTATARLVIGADGKHSLVAKTVHPTLYHEKPALSMAYYTYWADVPVSGGELYSRERRAVGAWPTNDGLVMTYIAGPATEFHAFRADIEGNVLRALDQCGTLGERIRAGRRAERFSGTVDLPNLFRLPYGPGWALVGDAGLVMDPITGQGIGYAFRDAELLVEAIDAGLGGRTPLERALAGYERKRNEPALGMCEFTTELASFAPPKPEALLLFSSLVGKPKEIERFFGVLTGTVPLTKYMSPGNLMRIIGPRAMAKLILGKMSAGRSSAPSEVELAPPS